MSLLNMLGMSSNVSRAMSVAKSPNMQRAVRQASAVSPALASHTITTLTRRGGGGSSPVSTPSNTGFMDSKLSEQTGVPISNGKISANPLAGHMDSTLKVAQGFKTSGGFMDNLLNYQTRGALDITQSAPSVTPKVEGGGLIDNLLSSQTGGVVTSYDNPQYNVVPDAAEKLNQVSDYVGQTAGQTAGFIASPFIEPIKDKINQLGTTTLLLIGAGLILMDR